MKWVFLTLGIGLIITSFANNNYMAKLEELVGSVVLSLSVRFEWNRDVNNFINRELPSKNIPNYSYYDYIIVGSGSAGSTLAARLTELPNVRVLLIEAGNSENLLMDIPYGSLALHFVDSLNYRYRTENTGEYCRGMVNGQCVWPMGRATGGNSAFNFFIATRGHPEDYNDWAEETGDSSWNYESMLKYFKKLENFNVEDVPIDNTYHNYNGPIYISRADFKTPYATSFVQAGQEVFGLPSIDYNGANHTGFSLMQSTLKNNERWSVNRAYLQPARNRRNLFITRNSRVTKILIKNKTAYGVRFIKNNKEFDVFANKEVILSAGTMESPKLLMLSGIGPKKHLEQTGISCIKNSPGVGDNLLDHPGYGGLIFKVKKGTGLTSFNIGSPFNKYINDYVTRRKGPLTNPIFNAIGFVNSRNVSSTNERSDMELLFSSAHMAQDPFVHRIFGISEEYFNKFYGNIFEQDAFQIWPVLLKPKSTGRLFLRSANPADKPVLFANYLNNKEDIETMIRGIRLTIKLGKARIMKTHRIKLYENIVPGCENYKYDSNSYWECALRTFIVSCNHHVGTCKMGLKDDKHSVVDSKLRVIGINNLRVCDASVMPTIPAAHVNLPTIAIAEKLSDIIKSDIINSNKN